MKDTIKDIIQKALPNATIYVSNPFNDGEHFQATVIDESFEKLSLVKQHQAVMGPLKEAFATSVHALALKTYTPKKWEEEQHK